MVIQILDRGENGLWSKASDILLFQDVVKTPNNISQNFRQNKLGYISLLLGEYYYAYY